MKKLSAIILMFIFLMSMLVPTSVGAAFTEENISVIVNAFGIDVTVTTDAEGAVVAHLTNEAKNVTFGLDYCDTPTESGCMYTYTFEFEMERTEPTQKLCIRVGDAVPTTEKIINYANINDKNAFFNGLDAVADVNLVDEYLSQNSSFTSVDIAAYLSLSGNVLAMVSDIIEALPLDTGYDNLEDETDEYTAQKVLAVSAKETLFNEKFTEAMKYAKIADADENTWAAVAQNSFAEGLFDSKYFMSVGTVPAILTASEVYNFFGTEVLAVEELTADELSNAFDRAVLMAIENKAEYGTLKEAFLYLEDKGSIVVSDMSNIDLLVNADTDADFWKDLKAGTYTDCAALIAKAVEMANTAVSGGNGGNGGGIGGGNGGSSITNTSSPGGFTGGNLGGSAGGVVTPVTPAVPEGAFSDIDSVEWAKEAIEALAELGILSGKGDGKFYPNDSVTREEFVKIIIAAFDLLDETAECDFNDVDKDSWSYPYIASANKLGIVTGDGENFNPKSGISRQDMAVIIYRVFEHLGLEVSGDAITFDDGDDIADYAKDAVDALTAAGIINGMGDGTYAPKEGVTRAQAAKVVYGLLQLVGGGK